MKPLYILLILAGSALSLSGQKTFSGPASGYVFDSVTQSIRAVVGLPGAAYLDAPAEPSWDFVSIAPGGTRGLGVMGLSINLIPDLSQPASFSSIAQAPGSISRIAWSADSTTVAIWSSATGQLWRITGLDSAPAVHSPISLIALGGGLSGWSLSGDGGSVALAGPALGTSSIYLSSQDADPVPVSSVGNPGAMAFSSDATSLFVFSATESRILLLNLPSGAVAGSLDASAFELTRAVAAGSGGIREERRAGPRLSRIAVEDLAASADGSRLYAVGGKKLCSYDLPTLEALPCSDLSIAPESFQPMPGGLLLLNYPRSGSMPFWLLNAETGQTWFVPSGSPTPNASF